MFKITAKDKKTKARLGLLETLHGVIKTPSYVIVATHARIKCLKPPDIKKTKTQIIIANTYHLWNRVTKAKKGTDFVHKALGINMPVMTDSGGFQVFSLGFGRENKVGKILTDKAEKIKNLKRKNIKITSNGVYFSADGKKKFLGPELSMKLQKKIGADIMFAFDECTSPLDGYDYNKKALKRTHEWAVRCLEARKNRDRLNQSSGKLKQMLFGIVQGGKYKDLRIKSAKFIGSLPFEGFGIGGSFGKKEMAETLKWVIPYLPEDKPRHLLGIGKVEDIFSAVENGIDLFDCVIPTREARHGRIYTKRGHYDILKNHSKNALIEKGCKCPTCKVGITRGRLQVMFKSNIKEKQKAQPVRQAPLGLSSGRRQGRRYGTIHNVWFFNNLLENIRNSIKKGNYFQFKNKFLAGFRLTNCS